MNKKDFHGQSPLSFAASYGYLDVVQILLNADSIEIDSIDNGEKTPLSHSALYPHVVAVLQH